MHKSVHPYHLSRLLITQQFNLPTPKASGE
ncbi:hypothetical protein C8P70_11566 [Myroides indicus]|uniref:Uncharacterized protein n=1 Tax=Myroides indicus TaxID=1323422 RepID=A0A4R7EVL3_9FLAO|nr:hypothetical protein C8P70_11566 [Myroides indicus]